MNEIISYLVSPPFTGWLSTLRVIFLTFSLLFLSGIVYFLIKTSWLRLIILQDLIEFFSFRPYGAKRAQKKWKKILSRLKTGLESEAKLALIETEVILDETLKELGYPDETLGERLKKVTPDILSNTDQVLESHKICNNIRHDPTYKLSLGEAKKSISIYEKALKDLEAL